MLEWGQVTLHGHKVRIGGTQRGARDNKIFLYAPLEPYPYCLFLEMFPRSKSILLGGKHFAVMSVCE